MGCRVGKGSASHQHFGRHASTTSLVSGSNVNVPAVESSRSVMQVPSGYSANVQFYPCTAAVWALMANGDGGTGETFMAVMKALQPIVEPLAAPSKKWAP